MTQAEKIIKRLEEGPATSADLNAICFRFSARIHELRREGHDIRSERIKAGLFRFTLVGDKVTEQKTADAVGAVRIDESVQATLVDVAPAKRTQDWG